MKLASPHCLKPKAVKIVLSVDSIPIGNLITPYCKIKGKISFLFMGDAGKIAENIILDSKVDISANVLKVGHHGSSTSTSNDFLSEVNPDYAVISVGEGNDYNHPASSTLEKLKSKGIKIYRTDKLGTIIASTDGTGIQFSTDK
jgi:competence protein ComEC